VVPGLAYGNCAGSLGRQNMIHGGKAFSRMPHMWEDEGEWTVVRQRGQKEHRQDDDDIDMLRQEMVLLHIGGLLLMIAGHISIPLQDHNSMQWLMISTVHPCPVYAKLEGGFLVICGNNILVWVRSNVSNLVTATENEYKTLIALILGSKGTSPFILQTSRFFIDSSSQEGI
jgi:nitrate reductase gamma subunit